MVFNPCPWNLLSVGIRAKTWIGSLEFFLDFLSMNGELLVWMLYSNSTVFTDGLLSMLREQIVPRLRADVPNEPTEEQLQSDPYMSRFALVFDREGYSPQFFKDMWEARIACYTYNKSVKDNWAAEEFSEHTVCFPDGQSVMMQIAERGVFVGGKLWIREIRKLTKSGHQTSLLNENTN